CAAYCEHYRVLYLRIQVVGLKVESEHMRFPSKNPTLAGMLFDMFDISGCASYYDGNVFLSRSPFIEIRKVVTIRPQVGKLGTNLSHTHAYRRIVGMTPILHRDYVVGFDRTSMQSAWSSQVVPGIARRILNILE